MPTIIKDLRELKGLTIEQSIMINEFYKKFDVNAVAGTNKRIVNVEPYFYQGNTGGNELFAYVATKLYICFDLNVDTTTDMSVIPISLSVYNELNTVSVRPTIINAIYNTTTIAINYIYNSINYKNFYFGRLAGNYNLVKFIGYRITLD